MNREPCAVLVGVSKLQALRVLTRDATEPVCVLCKCVQFLQRPMGCYIQAVGAVEAVEAVEAVQVVQAVQVLSQQISTLLILLPTSSFCTTALTMENPHREDMCKLSLGCLGWRRTKQKNRQYPGRKHRAHSPFVDAICEIHLLRMMP